MKPGRSNSNNNGVGSTQFFKQHSAKFRQKNENSKELDRDFRNNTGILSRTNSKTMSNKRMDSSASSIQIAYADEIKEKGDSGIGIGTGVSGLSGANSDEIELERYR